MEIRIEKTELFLNHVRTRLPFKYGIATLVDAPQVFVRVHLRCGTKAATGVSSDILPPKWFTKIPEKALAEEIDEMLLVIRNALSLATTVRANSLFDFWLQFYKLQKQWGDSSGFPPLLSNFGVTLVERAAIEAFCKIHNITFHQALAANAFEINLGQIHPQLDRTQPSDFLPRQPLRAIFCRHTVGLGDALTEADVTDRPPDKLPSSLETAIKFYGLTHFKVKINGNIEGDLARMRKLAPLLNGCGPELYISLDGNEQYKSADDLRNFWNQFSSDRATKWLASYIAFIEQPFHREIALTETIGVQLQAWSDRPPIIIDESDAELGSYALALAQGYDGTSHKNCKGIFKGIANRCLTISLQAQRQRKTLMSGEDLGNIGPVSLLQDIAAMAALGIESVERNGHHYFPGLSMFPLELQNKLAEVHHDLYQKTEDGWSALRVAEGRISAETVNRSPFGLRFEPDLDTFFRQIT